MGPMSASKAIRSNGAEKASDQKLAMLNKIKEQTRQQFERKKQ